MRIDCRRATTVEVYDEDSSPHPKPSELGLRRKLKFDENFRRFTVDTADVSSGENSPDDATSSKNHSWKSCEENIPGNDQKS